MQFNYLCSFSNHVNVGKGPRQSGWNTSSLFFTDSLMAKQPAGLSQDVGCLSSMVQSQEKKNHSFSPKEMLQMFRKLQSSGSRWSVWTPHWPLASECAWVSRTAQGLTLYTLDHGAVWRFWGMDQEARGWGAFQELRRVTIFPQKNLNIWKSKRLDQGVPTDFSPSHNQHFYERWDCLEHTAGAALKGESRADTTDSRWLFPSQGRAQLYHQTDPFHTWLCQVLL